MNIVIIEPLGVAPEKLNELSKVVENIGGKVIAYDTRTENDNELIQRGVDADVIIVANQPLKKNFLENCIKLKMISVAFTGVDHIDLKYCKERKIVVSNAAGYSTNAVAELVFGLTISVLRNIIPCDTRARLQGTKSGLVGSELYGKKFGIVGTGAIGMKVSRIALAFGCEVLAYSRSRKAEFEEMGGKYVDMATLLKESDIISLHTPLNDKTKGMIGINELSLMKPSAILINAARGPIVDNKALADALNEGLIAGAGIDVFDMEPPLEKEMPLLNAKNTVLTPHVAFASNESLITRAEIVFDNIKRWNEGIQQNIIC